MKTRHLPVSRQASRSFADTIRHRICEGIERAPDRMAPIPALSCSGQPTGDVTLTSCRNSPRHRRTLSPTRLNTVPPLCSTLSPTMFNTVPPLCSTLSPTRFNTAPPLCSTLSLTMFNTVPLLRRTLSPTTFNTAPHLAQHSLPGLGTFSPSGCDTGLPCHGPP